MCGRPTRSGRPCRNPLSRLEVACKKHQTEKDAEISERIRRAFHEGMEIGRSTGNLYKEEVERLREELRQLRRQIDEASRYYEVDGDQVVEIDGHYAYRWSGIPRLEVGERVLLPPSWLSEVRGTGVFDGVVTGFGSTYDGSLSRVIRRAEPNA